MLLVESGYTGVTFCCGKGSVNKNTCNPMIGGSRSCLLLFHSSHQLKAMQAFIKNPFIALSTTCHYLNNLLIYFRKR